MSRRANQSPEARDRERTANRERMRLAREDPAYRDSVNAARAARDAERRLLDTELVERLRANQKRYYERRKDDPAFWEPRKDYIKRWKAERLENEHYEAFMARMETEETNYE